MRSESQVALGEVTRPSLMPTSGAEVPEVDAPHRLQLSLELERPHTR